MGKGGSGRRGNHARLTHVYGKLQQKVHAGERINDHMRVMRLSNQDLKREIRVMQHLLVLRDIERKAKKRAKSK